MQSNGIERMDASIVRFLLGEMSAVERSAFEEKCLKDSELFDRVAEVENDMLDLYTLGTLARSERERLERFFLINPERYGRLPFSRALRAYSTEKDSGWQREPSNKALEGNWLRPIPAVAIAVLLIAAGTVGSFFLGKNPPGRKPFALKQQEMVQGRKQQELKRGIDSRNTRLEAHSTAPSGLNQGPILGGSSASFALTTDALRGDGSVAELSVPDAAQLVVLHVIFPADLYSAYELVIETDDGAPIFHRKHLISRNIDPKSKELVIVLPSRLLKTGNYILRVSASRGMKREDVAGYNFSIVHH